MSEQKQISLVGFIDLKKIRINREYASLVFSMSEKEDEAFDQSIQTHGIRESLKLNEKNFLLDGHHRLKKAKKYKMIKVPYEIKTFENKQLEKKYVIECNLER